MKQNVLIIDDNTKNIQLAANVLKSTDLYNIFFATSGEKGIEQLKLRKHSLILLDINMPGMNGYETADIIKNDPLHKQIPIIFLSANANRESIHQGFEHGGSDYVTKPFDEAELSHRVKTHIELFAAREWNFFLVHLPIQKEANQCDEDDAKTATEQSTAAA